MLPETPNPRYRGFGKARSVVSVVPFVSLSGIGIEPAIALVNDHFMSPRVIPAGSVVVAAIDVVDDHLSVSVASPMLPVAVTKPLDPHHSWSVTLYHHSACWTTVAGIPIVHYHAAGNRAAANHHFSRYMLSVKRSCRECQTCNQRPCKSAGLHIGLDWWTGETAIATKREGRASI
jgi:hypothetical protein